jgi:RNA polymerase sigma-70 factor, ECF subfamily
VPALNDDGGRALPWPGYIVGVNHVARVLAAIGPALDRIGVTMHSQNVGSVPGVVLRDRNGNVLGAVELDIRDEKIQKIRLAVGPNGLG